MLYTAEAVRDCPAAESNHTPSAESSGHGSPLLWIARLLATMMVRCSPPVVADTRSSLPGHGNGSGYRCCVPVGPSDRRIRKVHPPSGSRRRRAARPCG